MIRAGAAADEHPFQPIAPLHAAPGLIAPDHPALASLDANRFRQRLRRGTGPFQHADFAPFAERRFEEIGPQPLQALKTPMMLVMQIGERRFQPRPELPGASNPSGQTPACRLAHVGQTTMCCRVSRLTFPIPRRRQGRFCEVGGVSDFNAATSVSNCRTRSISGRIRPISSSRDKSCRRAVSC